MLEERAETGFKKPEAKKSKLTLNKNYDKDDPVKVPAKKKKSRLYKLFAVNIIGENFSLKRFKR